MPLHDRVSQRADDLRSSRYAARRVLWSESVHERVRDCGRTSVTPGGSVILRRGAGPGPVAGAGFAGVSTCGSVWSCPVCSAKIAGERQRDLEAAIAEAKGRGWSVLMVTLTMRHGPGQRLATLWDALAYAWSKTTSGRGWVEDRARFGVQGFARVVELTHGVNGWHVHVHALIFCASGAQLLPVDVSELGASMFARWAAALSSRSTPGHRLEPVLEHGLDVRMVGDVVGPLGHYFTKQTYGPGTTASLEVARGDLKDARHGNRAPFAILRSIAATGDADDLDLWHEYERASHGRRQLTWSRDLRRLLGLAQELSDLEAAELDAGGVDVLVLPAASWRVVRGRPEDLLAVTSADPSGRAARLWLDERGIAWDDPPDGSSGPVEAFTRYLIRRTA